VGRGKKKGGRGFWQAREVKVVTGLAIKGQNFGGEVSHQWGGGVGGDLVNRTLEREGKH